MQSQPGNGRSRAALGSAAICAFSALAVCLSSGAAATQAAGGSSAADYVVVYSADRRAEGFSVTRETTQRERGIGFTSELLYRHVVKGFTARLSRTQVKVLAGDPEVALVTPDRPLSAAAVGLAAGEQAPTGVARIGSALDGTAREPSGAAVAVLDSGIDLTHPDLNAVSGTNCVGKGAPADDNGHGTLVAGVIGARNDGSGLVGVAPGTKLVSVKVLDRQGGSTLSRVICGIDWVTAHAASLGIKVANLSLGGFGPISTCSTDALHLAICNSTAAGVTYAVAAGNEMRDIGNYPSPIPASYPEVLTVTSMSDSDGGPGALGGAPGCPGGAGQGDDRYASFSNYALSAIDVGHTIAAPGVCIRSTAPGGGYASFSGTSAATPHAAGTVALCFSEAGRGGPCSGLRPAAVIGRVRTDAARGATAANGFLGDPTSSIGLHYGFLVSVVESTKLMPPPPPPLHTQSERLPPPDRTVSFEIVRIRSVHDRVRIVALMNEAGSLSARGAVRVTGRTVSLHRMAKRTGSPARITLVLKLARRSQRLVRRAHRGGHPLTARIELRAADGSGNSALVRREVRLRR
jgi:subtilisin